jgi:CRP-like cAMP-binding protein
MTTSQMTVIQRFPDRRRRALLLAGALALAGLITAVVYMLRSTPYTMIGFLVVGQAFIYAAIVIFAVTVVRDLRSRLDHIAAQHFKQGETIFRQGDPADCMYIISKGEVEAVHEDAEKGEVVIDRLGPEDYFGETAIFRDTPRMATLRALTDVEALVIHRSDFKSLYTHLPRLRERVHAEYERRKELVARAQPTASERAEDPDGTR